MENIKTITGNVATISINPEHPYTYIKSIFNSTKKYNFSGSIPGKNIYIKQVIYSNPATIIFWSDDTKTVCKCTAPDVYSEEVGLSLCILKKLYGATTLKQLFEDWIPQQYSFATQRITLKDVMKKHNK